MDKLVSAVRTYAWGSTTAIPELLGQEPTGEPQAELWVGAHPSAPSVLATTQVPLTQAIAENPELTLGGEIAARYSRLPYLMKVLAAAEPLSLQVHPTLEQAAEGFAREQERGPALDSPTRNYKDDQHKPEMILALTPFDALCGFRDPFQAARAFRWLQEEVSEPLASEAAAAIAAALERDAGDGSGLREAATVLLARDEGANRLAVLGADRVEEVMLASAEDQTVEHPGRVDDSLPLLPRLASVHPGDTGVLLALLLNLVRLAPGEAMSLGAGHLHAYLEGVGVEIMANSDNVLRGGLTPKHVDVAELLSVVDFAALEPRRVMPFSPVPGLELYFSGFDEFDLARLTHVEAPIRLPGDGPAEIVVVGGTLTLTAQDGSELVLKRGDTAFVPAADEPVMASGSVDVDAYIAVTDLTSYVEHTGL
ncbi:MAG: mannose-6-phosphate isomerase, class I [Galactobacter sp.]